MGGDPVLGRHALLGYGTLLFGSLLMGGKNDDN